MNLDLCDGDEGRVWLADLERGFAWREALEAHLLRLDLVRAERLMQVLKEGRGAWLALVLEHRTRRVWFVGNALSGAVLVLARLGAHVTVFDPSEQRGALALVRDRSHARGTLVFERWTRTTFDAAREAPDLCVVEGPVPQTLGGDEELFARFAALRVPRVFAVVDNRFSYKRSTGVRADLRVQSPLAFARRALTGPERSLGGTRRALGRFGDAQALALYPHRWDFSHVVDVDDRRGPQLFIGPGERTNRAKMFALRAGLFTWLAPSFAVGGPRAKRALLDEWLAAFRERSGAEPDGAEPGRVEHLVATRGNNVLLLTSAGLALHVPLGPDQERQMRRHHELLAHVQTHVPGLAVPRPVWAGDVDGVFVQVESRVGAINGAQLVHEAQRERVMLPQCAELLARAVVSEARSPSAAELEELVLERARAAAARAGRDATARALIELGERCAAALAPLTFPRVFGHNDLRAKHVAVDERGNALALLDLGCARTSDLPFVDLLNLVLHDHKDHAHTTLGDAWRAARERRLPPALEAVLDRYEELLALPRAYTDAVRAAYPVFVAAAAEQNWDYSRPRWVHRQLSL